MYVCESFKGVRAANKVSSITIWDVISAVGGMEQGQATVAQSGLCVHRCPTGQQQHEDEVSEWKESPRRGDRASAALTERPTRSTIREQQGWQHQVLCWRRKRRLKKTYAPVSRPQVICRVPWSRYLLFKHKPLIPSQDLLPASLQCSWLAGI